MNMQPRSLEQLIRTLNIRMYRYRDELHNNEALTRYALIDPLLSALGWNLADPARVVPEYRPTDGERNAADYLLRRNEKDVVLVEAKPLDKTISEDCRQTERHDKNNWKQIQGYAKALRDRNINVTHVCLTNGDIWKWKRENSSNNFVSTTLSITSTYIGECVTKLIHSPVNRDVILSGCTIAQENLDLPAALEGYEWKSLTEISHCDGLSPPRGVFWNDNPIKKARWTTSQRQWKKVKNTAFEWLCQQVPNGQTRFRSSQVLKDITRLFYHCGKTPSRVFLLIQCAQREHHE